MNLFFVFGESKELEWQSLNKRIRETVSLNSNLGIKM